MSFKQKNRKKRVSWSTPVIDTTISPNRIIISSNGVVEAINLEDGNQIWAFDGVQKIQFLLQHWLVTLFL